MGLRIRRPPWEHRGADRLRAHYEIELELADRLRRAPAGERSRLYTEVYEELFRRVPDHPQLTADDEDPERERALASQMIALRPFLTSDSSFLEIGAGDCAFTRTVARGTSGAVHAIDVSPTILERVDASSNVQVHVTDGVEIPLAADSIDVAYSNQLMEHLHPDDALAQLRNIHRVLRPGGAYVCLTPNRLTGPHDISAYFAPEPRGFHLREYSTGDLRALFAEAGFRRSRSILRIPGRALVVPSLGLSLVERALEAMPTGPRRLLGTRGPFPRLVGRVAAIK